MFWGVICIPCIFIRLNPSQYSYVLSCCYAFNLYWNIHFEILRHPAAASAQVWAMNRESGDTQSRQTAQQSGHSNTGSQIREGFLLVFLGWLLLFPLPSVFPFPAWYNDISIVRNLNQKLTATAAERRRRMDCLLCTVWSAYFAVSCHWCHLHMFLTKHFIT